MALLTIKKKSACEILLIVGASASDKLEYIILHTKKRTSFILARCLQGSREKMQQDRYHTHIWKRHQRKLRDGVGVKYVTTDSGKLEGYKIDEEGNLRLYAPFGFSDRRKLPNAIIKEYELLKFLL